MTIPFCHMLRYIPPWKRRQRSRLCATNRNPHRKGSTLWPWRSPHWHLFFVHAQYRNTFAVLSVARDLCRNAKPVNGTSGCGGRSEGEKDIQGISPFHMQWTDTFLGFAFVLDRYTPLLSIQTRSHGHRSSFSLHVGGLIRDKVRRHLPFMIVVVFCCSCRIESLHTSSIGVCEGEHKVILATKNTMDHADFTPKITAAHGTWQRYDNCKVVDSIGITFNYNADDTRATEHIFIFSQQRDSFAILDGLNYAEAGIYLAAMGDHYISVSTFIKTDSLLGRAFFWSHQADYTHEASMHLLAEVLAEVNPLT